ncbi:MAG: hypothetical protein ACKPKO_61745, partial [Candidatus Fonsibacter sp.]
EEDQAEEEAKYSTDEEAKECDQKRRQERRLRYNCAANCGAVTEYGERPTRLPSGQWPKARCTACGRDGEDRDEHLPTLRKKAERVRVREFRERGGGMAPPQSRPEKD